MSKKRIQGAALIAALTCLTAVILGKYVIVPAIKYISVPWQWFLSGLAVISVCWQAAALIRGMQMSPYTVFKIRRMFPKSTEDLKNIGVETELDFCYAMQHILEYVPQPILTNTLKDTMRTYYDRRLYRRSIELFEEMFGRQPLGAWGLNWAYIAQSEAAKAFNAPIGSVPYRSFVSKVSRKVIEYFDFEHDPDMNGAA